jgi:hypothetical protein
MSGRTSELQMLAGPVLGLVLAILAMLILVLA